MHLRRCQVSASCEPANNRQRILHKTNCVRRGYEVSLYVPLKRSVLNRSQLIPAEVHGLGGICGDPNRKKGIAQRGIKNTHSFVHYCSGNTRGKCSMFIRREHLHELVSVVQSFRVIVTSEMSAIALSLSDWRLWAEQRASDGGFVLGPAVINTHRTNCLFAHPVRLIVSRRMRETERGQKGCLFSACTSSARGARARSWTFHIAQLRHAAVFCQVRTRR